MRWRPSWSTNDFVLDPCSVSVLQLGYHVVELLLLAGDGGEGELSLSLGEPQSGPEGARPPCRCVLPGSCPEPPAFWFLFFVGVTNVGYRRVAWCTTTVLQWQQYLLTRFGLHRPNSRENEVKLVLELHWFYRPMRSPFIWSAGFRGSSGHRSSV